MQIKLNLSLLLLFILFFLSSCSSSLDFHAPTQYLMPPEVPGRTLKIRPQLSYSNSTKYKLASLEQNTIFSTNVNVSTESGTSKDNIVNFLTSVGISNFMEAYYHIYGDSPSIFGGKVQLLGNDDGKREAGVKFSAFGGYGKQSVNDEVYTVQSSLGGSRDYGSVLKVEGFEFGSSLGYRTSSALLLYVSGVYRSYDASGALTSSIYQDVVIESDARIRALQLGMQVNAYRTHFLFEGGYVKSLWKGLESREDYTLGLAVGVTIF